MAFIRSISGLRATLGTGLQPEIISRYAAAFAQYFPEGPIVIGRDGRPSGLWMEHILIGTLQACGRDILLLGIAPTPTIQLQTEHSEAAGGISITASHNPQEWNGLKFLGSDGVFLDEQQNREFWHIVDNFPHDSSENINPGTIYTVDNAVEYHCNAVISSIESITKQSCSLGKQYTVVVDAVNASGSKFIPRLLELLGCEVIPLFCDNSGMFPHIPEPIPQNLYQLSQAVLNHKADFGIAIDPDADRLVLIDEHGIPIGEEKTIALSVKSLLSMIDTNEVQSVVVNLSTSRITDIISEEYKAKTFRSPVGEINVVKAMKQHHAIIGGEGSGGVILPSCHYGRDSLVGIALIIALLRFEHSTLSKISDSLPKRYIAKGKSNWERDPQVLYKKIADTLGEHAHQIRYDDGIWMDFGLSWIHVRISNTEPIVRFIAESDSEQNAEDYRTLIESIVMDSNT
jgi:phosphomannomutase